MPSILVPATNATPPPTFTKRATVHLPQFQLYAVEKWLVDRRSHTSLLLVYTGDPTHTVALDELVTEDVPSYDAALHSYRRDGAKPKQTPHGVLMVTSLAHFRSDWTIVNIPEGEFEAARDKLFANINLLRMGCSGRSALALDEPSDTTKDKFISLYHLPETSFSPPQEQLQNTQLLASKRLPTVRGKTRDSHTFIPFVLELVKLLQAALSIFGYYSSPIDGLLCDSTLDAITRWMADIGEPLLNLEPTERVVDPMFISAILSLVLTVRNKLSSLISLDFSSHQSISSNHVAPPPPPKDPFLFPQPFCLSLSSYLQATNSTVASTTLSPQIIEAIDSAYESATRRRLKPVRKVLRGKIDDHPQSRVDSEGDEKKDPRDRDPYAYNYRSGGEEPSSAPASAGVTPSPLGTGRLLALTSRSSSSPPVASAGLSSLTATTSDLASFLTTALTKEKDSDKVPSGPTFTGLHVRAHAQGRRDRRRQMAASISTLPDAPAISQKSRTYDSVDLGQLYQPGGGDAPPPADVSFTNARLFDTVVAGSVKALWSGRVAELVRLREYANLPIQAEVTPLRVPSGGSVLSAASSTWGRARSKSKSKGSSSINLPSAPTPNVHSDGDVNHPKSDTDDDSEGVYNLGPNASQTTFGSILGGKVKGKLGTWTAMAKRRTRGEGGTGSVDLTGTTSGFTSPVKSGALSIAVSPVVSRESAQDDESLERWRLKSRPKHLSLPPQNLRPKPTRLVTAPSNLAGRERSGSIAEILGVASGSAANNSSGPQSPTLPPMIAPGEDESEMLSSGQISPLSDYRPNPFNLLKSGGGSVSLSVPIGGSLASSTSNLIPSSSTAVQDTVSKLHSKLLNVTHQQRHHERAALGHGKRPQLRSRRLTAPSALPRVTSWSDPMSARHIDLGQEDDDGGNESDTEDEVDEEEPEDIPEEDEGDGYERLEGYAEVESDEPSRLLKTAPPLPTVDRRKSGSRAPSRRPTFKRKHLTSSVLGGGGSDGEFILGNIGEKTRFHSLLSVVDGDGVFNAEPTNFGWLNEEGYYEFSGDEGEGEKWMRSQRSLRRRGLPLESGHGRLTRRRSFHDLDDFRGMPVLKPERMRIDVEICGQILVMTRREEHLRNVMECLKVLNSTLFDTNSLLRQDYESNMSALSALEARTKVLAALDIQNAHADKLSQSTNIVRYEAEQFRVADLWHAADLSRQKVFALRQKVFGDSGRRRLPDGVHGAHGRFNRLQRTIGGQERLVDYLGRTESEVEEEEELVSGLQDDFKTRKRYIEGEAGTQDDLTASPTQFGPKDEEKSLKEEMGPVDDEEEPVEHSSIRPVWLLKFFVGWGARWSARAATNNATTGGTSVDSKPEVQEGEAARRSGVFEGMVEAPGAPSIIISSAEDDEPRKTR